jgi:hypothetical protein
LATKVQVLRNRGYALDASEEELKAKLAKLEQATFDPVVGGRQEELWARMTVVRERARVLREETERLGKAAGKVEEVGGLDEGVVEKVRQVCIADIEGICDYEVELTCVTTDLNRLRFAIGAFEERVGDDQEGV